MALPVVELTFVLAADVLLDMAHTARASLHGDEKVPPASGHSLGLHALVVPHKPVAVLHVAVTVVDVMAPESP